LNGEKPSVFFSGKKNEGVVITVNGDKDTFYPVSIQSGLATYGFEQFSVGRGYNWTAPDDWNTATHRGGLTFTWFATGDSAWGGNDRYYRVHEFNQTYSSMVAGLQLSVNGFVVWLRGGGAAYRFTTPAGREAVINVFDHDDGMRASNGTVYLPRPDDSALASEIFDRYPIRNNGSLSSIYELGERVYSPHNRPTPNDIGALSKVHDDYTPFRLSTRGGINGGYAEETGSGHTWGAPIWSLGDDWNGVNGAGTTYSVDDQYGLSWLRRDHPSIKAGVGEGLYIFESGVLRAAFGRDGMYTSGDLWLNDAERVVFGEGTDAEMFSDGNFNTFLDINGGGAFSIRDGNNSNAQRFLFDVDTGDLTGTRWIGNLWARNGSRAYYGDNNELVQYASSSRVYFDVAGSGRVDFRDMSSQLSPTKIRFDVPNGSIFGDLWTGSVHIGNAHQLTMGDSEELTQFAENGNVNLLLKGNGVIRLRDGTSAQPVPPTPIRFDVRDGSIHAIEHIGNVTVREGQVLTWGTGDETTAYYSNGNLYLDMDAGVDYILRERSDGETTKFYFDMSNGYLSGTRWVGQTHHQNGVSSHWGSSLEVSQHFTTGNLYTDIGGSADWYLRDRTSGNALRFLFDMSEGELHANRFIGVATDSEKLGGKLPNRYGNRLPANFTPQDHTKKVVLLHPLNGVNTNPSHFFGGTITFTRTNGIYLQTRAFINSQKNYATELPSVSMSYSGDVVPRLVTLTHAGTKYLGVECYTAATHYSITLEGEYSHPDCGKVISYLNVSTGTVLDAEVNSSIATFVPNKKTFFDGGIVGDGTSVSNVNAVLLDGIDSAQFLRSDVDDVKYGRLATDKGISGGYGGHAGSGTAWGANIWSMGDAYEGDTNGPSYGIGANHWGLSWLRASNPGAHAAVGDGIYVYRGGVLAGGLGHEGLYTTDATVAGLLTVGGVASDLEMEAGKGIRWNQDTDGAGIDFKSFGDGGANYLHFWTRNNSVEFFKWTATTTDLMTLKRDDGLWLRDSVKTDGKFVEAGVSLEDKYLGRQGATVKTMEGALRILGGINNVGITNDGALLDIEYRADSGDTAGLRIKMDGEPGDPGSAGGDWLIDCWANTTGANTTVSDRKFAVDGQGNMHLNGTFTWNGVQYSGFSTLSAGLLDNLDSTQFLRSDVDDIMYERLGVAKGINGGYGSFSGSGSDWAATIWAMGPNYGGPLAAGSLWEQPSYALAWQRSASPGYLGVAGEGLYLYSQGSLRTAMGHSGLYVTGQIYATDNITAYYSDSRLKVQVGEVDRKKALDAVLKSTKAIYRANDIAVANGYDPEKVEIGLFADEFLEVFPELTPLAPFDTDDGVTSKSKEEYRTFDYARYTTVLSAAMEHMHESHTAELNEVRKENEVLREEVAELKSMLNGVLAKLSA
jgi:hypothetical protein